MNDKTSQMLRLLLAIALMALAANSFLKYLWWTACYSAWYGIPKLAEQWKAAGSRATLNGWGVVFLDAASVVTLCTVIGLRDSRLSPVLKTVVRVIVSLAITIAGTAVLVLALSWLKQGIH
jgi:hypothetical protein